MVAIPGALMCEFCLSLALLPRSRRKSASALPRESAKEGPLFRGDAVQADEVGPDEARRLSRGAKRIED